MALVLRLGRWEYYIGVENVWPWPLCAGRGQADVWGLGAWLEVY